MKKIVIFFIVVMILSPGFLQAQEYTQSECIPEKIINLSTITGTLIKYTLEENTGIPSEIVIKKNREKLNIITDVDEIVRKFKNRIGKKFCVTYENVYGWIGDECNKFNRFVSAERVE